MGGDSGVFPNSCRFVRWFFSGLRTVFRRPSRNVSSGNLTFTNDDLQSTGNAQTDISETGGSVTLRDDTVESTGAAQTAISVSGGTADLGTPGDPGGNTLSASEGSATSLIQTSGTGAVSSDGNTSEAAGSPVPSLVASLSSGPAPSIYGQQVTFTATVEGVSAGGTVQFLVDGSNFGQPVALGADGNATLVTTDLPAGTDSITAVYQGLSFGPVTQTVDPAMPVITWANPSAITYSTALSGTEFDATASVPGTFVYTPAANAVLGARTQTLSVTFTPTDNTDYTSATQTTQLIVNQATPVITWPTPASITYGTALSSTQLDATASVSGRSSSRRPPAPSFTPVRRHCRSRSRPPITPTTPARRTA